MSDANRSSLTRGFTLFFAETEAHVAGWNSSFGVLTNGGTCFAVELLFRNSESGNHACQNSTPRAHSVEVNIPRVLIVDDELSIRELLVRIVESEGLEAIEAEDGSVALE